MWIILYGSYYSFPEELGVEWLWSGIGVWIACVYGRWVFLGLWEGRKLQYGGGRASPQHNIKWVRMPLILNAWWSITGIDFAAFVEWLLIMSEKMSALWGQISSLGVHHLARVDNACARDFHCLRVCLSACYELVTNSGSTLAIICWFGITSCPIIFGDLIAGAYLIIATRV